ncbi:MAG: type II toxin-antitoxin system RelE/ParE family toxin [Bacteroidales bacterium]|nr:type II toxin-antitoxin system RelE/ParE family toxin [Bacteroidales bacterium]
MEILYSDKATKQLKKIAKGSKKNAKMIMEGIEEYVANPSIVFDIKVLNGKFCDFKRLRIGNYRVIFDENNNIMYIYQIKHRQEAYK